MRRWVMLVMACAVVQACSRSETAARLNPPQACRPVDSAWAIQLHAIDAESRRPVSSLRIDLDLKGTETDSSGWVCLRTMSEPTATLRVSRRGYEDENVVVSGRTGDLVQRELLVRRVPRPCCDLRGRWRIAMQLEKPSDLHPKPSGRTTAGEMVLGPHVLAPQEDDDLDSLVRVTRGLHKVDFTPFFGGAVAPDVSRSVFGSGPDLLHEVEALASSGDKVEMTFIPRMSHGSISFGGRIHGDTVRGTWVQNAYCCGASGRFEMVRVGAVDTTPPPAAPPARERRGGFPPADTRAGTIPCRRWRPALAVAHGGSLWLACGGLFVADSLHGVWRLVLGGSTDPVDADDLRIGSTVAFVDAGVILVSLTQRYSSANAPVLYRSADGGAHWAAVSLPDVDGVQAMGAIGNSVWLVPQDIVGARTRILASDDGGRTWRALSVPDRMLDATHLHRVSRDTAFVATGGDSGSTALWRTVDAGLHWAAVPTPHDQGLHRVPPGYVRVEEIATIGQWLVVTELGRVFARPVGEQRWRALPGLLHVASEPGGRSLFALTDSLRPVMLDSALRIVWRAPGLVASVPGDAEEGTLRADGGRTALIRRGDVEDVLMRAGRGYVSISRGNVLQAGPAVGMQWLAAEPQQEETRRGARIQIMIGGPR